jgi:putative CRISPR-associated protein (TIGR02620 family)
MAVIYEEAKTDIEAALAAIEVSRRKSAKVRAWSWAETAITDAVAAGVKNAAELVGGGRYPDFDALEVALKALAGEVVIVTRHNGLVAWLAYHGIEGQVITHASLDQIRGKHVYGALPLHLAAEAASVTVVDLPDLPSEKRGQELSPSEMDVYGASLVTYRVEKVY